MSAGSTPALPSAPSPLLIPRGLDSGDPAEDDSEAMRIQKLKEELREAKRHETLLDLHTASLQDALRKMADNDALKQLAYLTHVDIRNIPCFTEDTLLAVKAPYGSTLEVPDPDEGMAPGRRRHEIQLSSRAGPIDVFLIQDANEPSSEASMHSTHLAQQPGDLDETLLKHFDFPQDGGYNYELKADEGVHDLYGFDDDVFNSMFNAP